MSEVAQVGAMSGVRRRRRRLRGALEAWAARLPAAKAAAVRDFAMRASSDVFITAEAEREVLTKRGKKDYLGSKLVSIATLTVNEVLVRVVVVPETTRSTCGG